MAPMRRRSNAPRALDHAELSEHIEETWEDLIDATRVTDSHPAGEAEGHRHAGVPQSLNFDALPEPCGGQDFEAILVLENLRSEFPQFPGSEGNTIDGMVAQHFDAANPCRALRV